MVVILSYDITYDSSHQLRIKMYIRTRRSALHLLVNRRSRLKGEGQPRPKLQVASEMSITAKSLGLS